MGQGLAFPDRNTPTSVGKTSGGSCLRVRSEKHPHERGEDGRAHDRSGQLLETPPRAWGRQQFFDERHAHIRNTPTSVGKTVLRKLLLMLIRKHPHERGEDYGALSKVIVY